MSPFIIPVFIPNKGCPFQCIFCDQTKTSASNISFHQVISIQKHIESWLYARGKNAQSREIAFYGGTFTALPFEEQEKFLNIACDYIKKGVVNSIRVSTRPDYIDEARVNLLKRYSVQTVELGVQSMDDEVLKLSGRGYKSDAVISACDCLKKNGFKTGIQLMAGLPGDSFEKSEKSVQSAISLSPDFVRIYPVIVIKHTELEKMFFESSYTPLTLDQAVEWSAMMLVEFKKRGINVIRIGLQPDSELEKNGNIVSGPYHPAFRQLVEAYIAKRVMINILKLEDTKGKSFIFYVPQNEVSNYIGQKRENIITIKDKLNVTITIKPQLSLKQGMVEVDSGDGNVKSFNILDHIGLNDNIKS